MAIVTSDILLLTQAGVKTDFSDAYVEAQQRTLWPKIASQMDTTLPTQNYAWLGRGAVMELFRDEAREQGAIQYSYSLSDNIYKARMVVERKALEDDQYAQIRLRAGQLGDEPPRFQDQLMFTALDSGFSNNGYDAKTFFANNHQEGASPTQSNLISSPLSDAALEVAATTMMNYRDDKNVPMNIIPDTLVVGPLLARRAWNLVSSDVVVKQVGDGTAGSGAIAYTNYGNYFNGRYMLIVSPYITSYHWFLLQTNRRVKPLVLQMRSDVPVTFETDMDLATAQIKEEYQFSVRGRFVGGYGLWQEAYGSNATS
jgi:phage major head subunit gpT-like protein